MLSKTFAIESPNPGIFLLCGMVHGGRRRTGRETTEEQGSEHEQETNRKMQETEIQGSVWEGERF